MKFGTEFPHAKKTLLKAQVQKMLSRKCDSMDVGKFEAGVPDPANASAEFELLNQ